MADRDWREPMTVGLDEWASRSSYSGLFDTSQPSTIRRTVAKFDWKSPHSEIALTEDGVLWEVQCGPPSGLLRAGWERATLTAGMTISAKGFRGLGGIRWFRVAYIMFPNGRQMSAGNPLTDELFATAERQWRQ